MNVELRQDVTPEEKHKLLRAMLQPLAEAMVSVCETYHLIEQVEGEGYIISRFGKRVLLHLFAAHEFVKGGG